MKSAYNQSFMKSAYNQSFMKSAYNQSLWNRPTINHYEIGLQSIIHEIGLQSLPLIQWNIIQNE
jgi:hypothetical protein